MAEAEMCYIIEGIGVDDKMLKHIRRQLRWNWHEFVDNKAFYPRGCQSFLCCRGINVELILGQTDLRTLLFGEYKSLGCFIWRSSSSSPKSIGTSYCSELKESGETFLFHGRRMLVKTAL